MTENDRLLILEDDSLVAGLLKALLNNFGFDCDVVTTEEAAIESYSKALISGKGYAAVIFDLVLASDTLGGLRALQRIKESNPGVKSILCSGFTNSPVVQDYHSYGFDSCLKKPFSGRDLCGAISRLLVGNRKATAC